MISLRSDQVKLSTLTCVYQRQKSNIYNFIGEYFMLSEYLVLCLSYQAQYTYSVLQSH
jgi:hypothetical protein